MRKIIVSICLLVLSSSFIFAESNHLISDKKMPNQFLSQLPLNNFGYANIHVNQLKPLLAEKNFTLINVHIPISGGIPKTDANIAYNQMKLVQTQFPDKEQPLVIYCRSGSMSKAASKQLVKMGYKNIIEVTGGFNAWNRAGYKLN